MTFNGGRRRSVGRSVAVDVITRPEKRKADVAFQQSRKRKKKNFFLGFFVVLCRKCCTMSPTFSTCAIFFQLPDQQETIYTVLLSHCVVVASEFITTGWLELFAAMAIEIINPLRRVWTAERKVKFRRTTFTQKRGQQIGIAWIRRIR